MRRLALAVLSVAFLVAGVVALVFLGASQPATAELTEEQKAEIAAEVDSVMNEWWTVWSTALDYDRGMSFFLDEPETAWADDGQVYYTATVIDETFRPFFAGLQRQDLTPIDSRTIVLTSDVVYTIRHNTIVAVDTAGNAGPEIRFAETIVWVKRNGEWKVLLGHGSIPPESM